MTHQQILAALQQIAAQHLQRTEPLQLQHSLAQDVAPDSLARMTLVVEIENHFRICLADEEAAGLQTVDDAIHLIGAKLATAQP